MSALGSASWDWQLDDAERVLADQGRPAWQLYAACAGMDPAIFFPVRGQPADEARAVCAGCAVQAECLAYAEDTRAAWGVWGGVTTSRRQNNRNRRG